MIRTWKERGLVILTAVPLLGVVPMAAVAGADGASRSATDDMRGDARGDVHEDALTVRRDAAPKPPPRPRTHAAPKPRNVKPRAEYLNGLAFHTSAPRRDVVPGHTYAWKWTFHVTDKGRARSGKAVFRTTLPTSLAFVSGGKDCTSSGRKVACRLGTVQRGHRIGGVVRAKVARWAKPGRQIGMTGVVTWDRTRVTRTFPVVRVARTADLAISETAPSKSRAGAKIPYRLRVRNLGPSTAEHVTVESSGPIRLVGQDTACARRHQGYVCAVGPLRAGESRTLHLEAVPRKGVRAGTVLKSSWRATSPTADSDWANNTAVVHTRITGRR